MAYATITDLNKKVSDKKLAELSDFANEGNQNPKVLNDALEEASSLVDSFAGGKFTLPLAKSKQVIALTVALAIYGLHQGRQFESETVTRGKEDAMSLLKAVAAGTASLDQPALTQVPLAGPVTKDHKTDPDRFDELFLVDY